VTSSLFRRGARVVSWSTVAFVATVVAISVLAAMANQVMTSWGKAYATDDPARLPAVDVALVLGTLPYDRGRLNPSFNRRLSAAVELWQSGKVKYLIVSGNRESDSYDEPTVMRDVLVQRGVPSNVIYRDFAGLRTVTSIARARDIYGQKRLIIVSQRDHIDRALFLARHMGVEAWGYDAIGSVPFMLVRDYRSKLAVIYAYWDLVIGPRQASGRRVSIGVDPPE
jgi:SanA protein